MTNMLFEYKAINSDGKNIEGQIEAFDANEAQEMITSKGISLVSLVKKNKITNLDSLIEALNKVSKKDLVVFSRQFSVMLKASVPIVQALRILVRQTKNPKLKTVLTEVGNEVDGGMKLSQAMSRHPNVFSNFFVAMIESGETSGRLDEVLEYLANQQEKDYDLTSKIKGAMIYPIFIVIGLFAVGIIMMVAVIPKLTEVLQETGQELPMSTKILIGVSDFMSAYWWLIIILVIGIVVAIKFLIKTDKGRDTWDWMIIKLPIFGKLFKHIYLVRITRSLGTLSSGGIPLVEALRICSQVVTNNVYKNILLATIKEVEEGNTIASVFIEAKEVPAMVSYMIGVGEQTGKLDIVLEKLSDFYAREVDNLVTNLVSLIEPLIMVVLGVAVGMMVAAIIMPMYNMASGF